LSRLLAAPGVEVEPRTLGVPDPVLDAAARAAIERAVAEAYAKGRRDGAADAAAAAEQSAARVLAGVQRSDAELRQLAADADVALALEIARAVLDREPADDGLALLARITEALATVEDELVTVRVSPADAAVLRAPLARAAADLGAAVELSEDPSMPEGEAVLAGRWSRADLTRAGAWSTLQTVLTGEDVDG
jgi:flagellar biosynthesis/type III secretory pathway protein FliH